MSPSVQAPAVSPPTDFQTFLVLEKGLQPVTVRNHVRAIARIERRTGPLSLSVAQAFVASLYQSTASYSHKSNSVTSIEHYLEYLGTPHRFHRQRKPRPLVVQVLSEAEIASLVFVCRTVREKAMVALLAHSGVRPKELCQLRSCDVDTTHNQLRIIQGKGLKDGVIHIPAACVQVLRDYLVESHRAPGDFLFVTHRDGHPYTQLALRKLIRRVGKRAGIARRIYPYLLRHSLATHMISRGAPLLAVKQQLRHAYLETTWHYVASLGYDPESQFDRFFPSYL
jgi:site-specific recombinase XerD